jgi:TrmH family RNA methyltransferase
VITSLRNPLVKQIRKLHSHKGRQKQNLFLIEGTHLIVTACTVKCSLEVVCVTPAWLSRHPQLVEKLGSQAQRLEAVSPEVLAALSTTINPDGIIATACRFSIDNNFIPNLSLGIVLERLQDPGNLGTIIRTAVAAGADGLWLSSDSVDIDNPKVLRSSAGEWFRLPTRVSDDLAAVVQHYQTQGVRVIATLPQASKTYWDLDFSAPSLILLGNEGAGLSGELLSLADEKITIPLSGGVESLNVAIAAALLLYERKRQISVLLG